MPYMSFRLPFGYFLYDRNVNKLVEIGEPEYRVISGEQRGSFETSSVMSRFHEVGFCLDNSRTEIEHPATEHLKYHLEQKVENIVLQVTQNCNLRCAYCAYSGVYNTRTHSHKRMSLQCAKAAIDFAIQHSSEKQRLAVSFYGGEPFLEFKLIKEVVSYIESKYPEKEIMYATTTNGTLLTDEVVDFLVEKSFNMLFSVDGPKEVHDINRKFTSSNEGSFSVLEKKLNRIKQRYPEFYKEKCRTNTVLSPDEDYSCVKQYFETDCLMSEISSVFGLIRNVGRKAPIQYKQSVAFFTMQEQCKILLWMLGKIQKKNTSKLYINFKEEIIVLYKHMKIPYKESEIMHPGGPCVPGEKKTFVDVDGNIYPCEKVSETPSMCIGDIYHEFDYEAVEKLLNVGRLTKEECKECWAFMRCTSCIAFSSDECGPSRAERLAHCDTVKRSLYHMLETLALLKHYRFDFENQTQED